MSEQEVAGNAKRIVVGVEGSGGAKAALRWAITQASAQGATVDVVTAWAPTYVAASPDFSYVPVPPVDVEQEINAMQKRVVDEVIGQVDASGVNIVCRLVRGRPVDSLIEASKEAQMLVVGSRGRGGFRGLLLGSVSQQLAQHASCPLVIVRPDLLMDPIE